MFKVSWDEKWIAQKQMIVTHRTDAPVRTTSSISLMPCMHHDEEQKKKKKKEKKRATTNKVWHTAAAVPFRSVDMPRIPTVSTPEK